MAEVSLPDDVRRLIESHIDSVEQLEILLLLARTPGRGWSAGEVASELRITGSSAETRLADLRRRALVAEVSSGAFAFDGRSSGTEATVRRLADAYKERRVAVITYIFSKPRDSIQAFADAFKVK